MEASMIEKVKQLSAFGKVIEDHSKYVDEKDGGYENDTPFPCFRFSLVGWNKDTGKKKCQFETPSKTSDDIDTERQGSPDNSAMLSSVSWKRYLNDPNDKYIPNISMYIKFIPYLYCIDFDDKQPNDREFLSRCMGNTANGKEGFCETLWSETKKGYHFYYICEDAPEDFGGLKIGKDKYGDIDVLGRFQSRLSGNGDSNMWENANNILHNTELNTIAYIDWADIKGYFDLTKCKKKVKKNAKQKKKDTIQKNMSECVVKDGIVKDEILQKYLDRIIRPSRYNYKGYTSVGMALKTSGSDDESAFLLWNAWVKKDPLINTDGEDGGHSHRTLDYNREKWESFNTNDQVLPLSWVSLRYWANQDDPQNEYQEIYNNFGEKGLVEYMNQSLFMIRDVCMVGFIDPEDNTDTRGFKTKRPTDIKCIFSKFQIQFETDDGKVKRKNPFDIWMTSHHQRQVSKIIFDPRPDAGMYNAYNMFEGYDIQPEHLTMSLEDATIEIQPLLDHLYNSWASKDAVCYNYILDWMAWVIQKPHIKTEVILCVRSVQGCGKGIVIQFLQAIIGNRYYHQETKLQNITKQFNALCMEKTFVFLDEAFWGGERQLNGIIKGLITEKRRTIEQKGIDAFQIDDYSNYILASNDIRATSVESGDRRHFILEPATIFGGTQNSEEQKQYFINISGDPTGQGTATHKAEAFAKFLYSRDISKVNLRNIPHTKEKSEQIKLNWSPVPKWWYNVLLDGRFSILPQFRKDTLERNSEGELQNIKYDTSQLEYGNIITGVNGFEKSVATFVQGDPCEYLCFFPQEYYIPDSNSDDWRSASNKFSIQHPVFMEWCSLLKEHNKLADKPFDDLDTTDLICMPYFFYMARVSQNTPEGIGGGRKENKVFKNMSSYKFSALYDSPVASGEDSYDTHKRLRFMSDIDYTSICPVLINQHSPAYKNRHYEFLSSSTYLATGLYPSDVEFVDGEGNITDQYAFDMWCKKYCIRDIKAEYKIHTSNSDRTNTAFDKYESGVLDPPVMPVCKKSSVFHYNTIHRKYKAQLYDMDWFYEKFRQNSYNIYGAQNVDVGIFWREMEEFLGGDGKSNPDGRFRKKRRTERHTDGTESRRQMIEYVDIDTAREMFRRSQKITIDWEAETE